MGEEGLEALGKPPRQRSEERHMGGGGQERFFLFMRGERLPLHDQQQQAGCNYVCIIGLINISGSPQTSMYFLYFFRNVCTVGLINKFEILLAKIK
jgi:hypothetical protein